MRQLVADLASAARVLRRSPAFTLAAILTLGLGIGANTAIFSIVNSVLFRPLPSPGLDRLFVVRGDVPVMGATDVPLAPPEVLDLAARTDLFDAVTGHAVSDRTLTGRGEPMRVTTATTLGDFARVFGIRPYLGHFHRPEQSLEGPFEAAVISYGLWQQLSGGDPRFIGSTLELNGVAYEVIGVMPAEFNYPRDAQLWVPFRYTGRFVQPMARGIWIMTAVARARADVTTDHLAAQLAIEAERWRAEHTPGAETGKLLTTTSIVEYMAGPLRVILFVLLGAVVFVLLIAAANVASLQLVRAAGRARELAVRAALGARGGRLARQLILESLLLAAAGGAVGLWLGTIALELFARWQPARQMHLTDLALDGTVLAFTAAVAITAAVAFGVAPALRAARVDPHDALRESGRSASAGRRGSRLLRLSVAVQMALALVLLLGSALMVRTLAQLLASDPGFTPANVVTAQVTIPTARYDTRERLTGFFTELLDRVRAVPGVENAAVVWGLPFTDQVDSSPFRLPGHEPRADEPAWHSQTLIASEDYFATMRIPLLRGSDFDGTERDGTPIVALINQTFAEQFFAGEDPVGRQLESGYFGFEPTTIIGVVGDVDHEEIGAARQPVIYYSYRQQSWSPWRSLVVRSSLTPEATARIMRAAVAELDANVPLYDVQTMSARIQRAVGPRRLAMLALGAFAALSLGLGALGVYGVMRYTTMQRMREIGIRLAIGAKPRDVVGMIVQQGMLTALAGLAAGIIVAFWLVRFMAGLLYGVAPHDPIAFLAATALLATVALLACWLPARRAARLDPLTIVRND